MTATATRCVVVLLTAFTGMLAAGGRGKFTTFICISWFMFLTMQITVVIVHRVARAHMSYFAVTQALVVHAAHTAHFVMLNLAMKTGVPIAAAGYFGKTGGES